MSPDHPIESRPVSIFTPCLIRELREPLIPWSVIMLVEKELDNVKDNEEKQHHTKQVVKGFLSISFINKYNRYKTQCAEVVNMP